MTLVSLPNDANLAGTANWADVYDNDAATTAVVNGDIRDDNISAAAAISRSKLAALASTHKEASGDLVLTAAYQDVPGLTYTLTATGTYLVNVTLVVEHAAIQNTGDLVTAQLLVNGAAQTVLVSNKVSAAPGTNVTLQVPASGSWIATANAGQIIKVQAKKAAGANVLTVISANSTSHMTAVQLG